MKKLHEWSGERVVDFKSLMDGGIIAQTSFVPQATSLEDFKALKLGHGEYKGEQYLVKTVPTEEQWRDMRFGWLVESGITSNSVIYVKDRVTVGIGTGEQDRVGVAEIARDKAYTKLRDRICQQQHGMQFKALELAFRKAAVKGDPTEMNELSDKVSKIVEETEDRNGGLKGARMVSDAFFPKRDGIDVGIREGIDAVIQPGGSERDFESIEAVNEASVAMVFTGQRSFKH